MSETRARQAGTADLLRSRGGLLLRGRLHRLVGQNTERRELPRGPRNVSCLPTRPVSGVLHRSHVVVLQPEGGGLVECRGGFCRQNGSHPHRNPSRAAPSERGVSHNEPEEIRKRRAPPGVLPIQQPELTLSVFAEVPRHQVSVHGPPVGGRVRGPLDNTGECSRGVGRHLSYASQIQPRGPMKLRHQLELAHCPTLNRKRVCAGRYSK